jgi:hypothetical protein
MESWAVRSARGPASGNRWAEFRISEKRKLLRRKEAYLHALITHISIYYVSLISPRMTVPGFAFLAMYNNKLEIGIQFPLADLKQPG